MQKRIINLISISCVIVLLVVVLMGCNGTNKIDKFYKKLLNSDSLTADIQMEVPIFGKVKTTMKIDGNKTYNSGFMGEGEEYTEIIDNIEYTYSKNLFGVWKKSSKELEEDETTIYEEEFSELFNSENYEYDKDIDKYVLKEGSKPTFLDGMVASSLTLELADNGCVFEGEVNSEGVLMNVSLAIKDINKTEIVLPTVD